MRVLVTGSVDVRLEERGVDVPEAAGEDEVISVDNDVLDALLDGIGIGAVRSAGGPGANLTFGSGATGVRSGTSSAGGERGFKVALGVGSCLRAVSPLRVVRAKSCRRGMAVIDLIV